MIEYDFISAITADPTDNTPRLIFCDWLEENGHAPRAEFVRAQIELSKPYKCPGGDLFCIFCNDTFRWDKTAKEYESCRKRYGLHVRIGELFLREWAFDKEGLIDKKWQIDCCSKIEGSIGPFIMGLIPRALLTRGFVSAITCSWEFFCRHKDLCSLHPLQFVSLLTTPIYNVDYRENETYTWFTGSIGRLHRKDTLAVDSLDTAELNPKELLEALFRVQWPTLQIKLLG